MRLTKIFAALLLLAILTSTSLAQDRHFESWSVGAISGGEGLYAGTVNDSKAVFGQYCFQSESTCYWLLANDTDCEAGSRYPVLVNSDVGATNLQILCLKLNGKARFAFTDFDAIDSIVKKSSRLGIAFPMKNGLFQVNRFALDGAPSALSFMRSIAEALQKKSSGTKDTTL